MSGNMCNVTVCWKVIVSNISIGEYCVDCGNVARTYPSGLTVCGCSGSLPGRSSTATAATTAAPQPQNWQNNPLRSE